MSASQWRPVKGEQVEWRSLGNGGTGKWRPGVVTGFASDHMPLVELENGARVGTRFVDEVRPNASALHNTEGHQ